MAASFRATSEVHGACAAFALLQFSTKNEVFTSQRQRFTPDFESRFATTCDICLDQNIQRRNSELYHMKMIRQHIFEDPTTHVYEVTIGGTFTDLICAQSAAYAALGIPVEDLKCHHSKEHLGDSETWPHGEDVFVHAVAHSGETLTLSIHAESNHADLRGDSHGQVCGTMYYTMQQDIQYSEDQNGYRRISRILGIYSTRKGAKRCAERVLLGDNKSPENFVTYEVFTEQGDSPWGNDTIIHAVAANGDTCLISVLEKTAASRACAD